MRCISCGANIPPEWVNAIQSNICPGCGNEIMNELTKELLDELSSAMERMPNDPQGVAGWLISNYRFQKVGSAEPVEKFHRKEHESGPKEVGELKVDNSYNEFIKRNNAADLVAKGEQLAKLKKSGNGKLADFANMIQGVGDPYGDDIEVSGDEGPNEADQEALMEFSSEGSNPFSNGGGITDMSEVIDPKEVESLMSKSGDAPLKEELALSQTEEGRNYLQRDRFKKLKAQEALNGGGGFFRR